MQFRGKQYTATQPHSHTATQPHSHTATWRECVSVGLLSFTFFVFSAVGFAQLLPPSTAIKWNKAGDGDWHSGANWLPATAPSGGEDVLFGSVPNQGSLSAITATTSTSFNLKSMWFDADSGISYTIAGYGGTNLGAGLPDNATLLKVMSTGTKVVETNINKAMGTQGPAGSSGWIINDSRGGLRFGGGFWVNSRSLKISGSGATHFAGELRNAGSISTVQDWVPHLILSGNNANWGGALNIGAETLVFIKANAALGTGANLLAHGGTLGFRSHAGTTLNYTAANTERIDARGPGAVRAWGQPAVGAIYHDGGGNAATGALNTFTGDIRLIGHTYFGARGDAGGLHLSGKITSNSSTNWPDGYWFIKTGPGLIALSNPNNAWLRTYIYGGVLRITHNNALPTGNLILGAGGILELGSGNFSRSLGAGSNQVRWSSFGGGFSAHGANREVKITDSNGNTANLTWFVGDAPLLLSSRYANAVIDFKNPINLGSGDREIRVERGSPNAHAVISGAITGSGSRRLVKTGPGLLHLTGGIDNTLVRINEGALLINNQPTTGQIELNGGVLGLNTDFTRNIGTGAGTIRWTGSGGFAAYGGDRTVKLNNSTASINWGGTNATSNFLGANDILKFGHYTATGTVIWHNTLNLNMTNGNPSRTIHVERGRDNNIADVVFNSQITASQAKDWRFPTSLRISGNGRMDIAVDNPNFNPDDIYITGVELRLIQAGSISAGNHQIHIFPGGTLTLDNMGTHNSTTGGSFNNDRIYNNAQVFLYAGTLRYIGYANGTSKERVGPLYLRRGSSTVDLQHIATRINLFTELAFRRLNVDGDSVFNYVTNTENFSKVRLSFANWDADANNTINGITPWGTVNGKDFITPVAASGVTELRPVTNYHTSTDQNTWNGSRNLSFTSTQTLGGARTINSLRLGAANLLTDTHTLTINSGGLLTYTGNPYIADSGTIKTGSNRPLYTHVYSNSLNFSGATKIDVPTLVKTGLGRLSFDSIRTHTIPNLYIHQGTVQIHRGNINATKIYIGDGAGRDILILPKDRTDPLINKPNVILHGMPYGLDPSNVYGGAESDQAILRLSGNTKQHINRLTIQDRGTIDFAGGNAGLANILWIDELSFSGVDDGRLFIRNWYQYEDYLLVRKSSFNKNDSLLSRIIFDGYQDFPVLAIDYDANYYQITPFHAPEPSTYGAILGAAGIGLVVWRKRKRRIESVK